MTIRLDLPPEVEGALMQAARRRGMTPEGLALDELRRLVPAPEAEAPGDAEEARQQTLREELFRILDEAQTLPSVPYDDPVRRSYREKPYDDAIVEKFRKQGFNL